jgi:hypothetical protein
MAWRSPISARLIAGVFAITALPPFGPFFSELRIVRAGLEDGRGDAVAVFVLCLLLAFVGLARLLFAIVDGRPRARRRGRGTKRSAWCSAAGLLLSLWLGIATPPLFHRSWNAACVPAFGAMTAVRAFGRLVNGASVAWKDVPERRLSKFVAGIDRALNQGARLCAARRSREDRNDDGRRAGARRGSHTARPEERAGARRVSVALAATRAGTSLRA